MNLKRILTTVLLMVLGCSLSFGQAYEKGDKLLNLGAGIGARFAPAGASSFPPLGLSFELGVSDHISVGAYGGYSGASMDIPLGGGKYNWTFIIVGARGAYHFDFGVDKLDPYLGAFLGYNIASVDITGGGPAWAGATVGGFTWAGFAGARYFFSDNIGAFAEVGYGIAILSAGITFKF